jgi:hypothetical protein
LVECLRGTDRTTTRQNAVGLSRLSHEFGYEALSAKVSEYLNATPPPDDISVRLDTLDEEVVGLRSDVELLQRRFEIRDL